MPSAILLVEDNEADLLLALRAFESHGLSERIVVARDGVEALDYLFCRGDHAGRQREELPCCVLLDIKLPRLDGYEVMRQIKADRRTAQVPVVVFTSSQEPFDVARSYELGVNSYLVKPLDFGEFRRMAGEVARYWLELNIVASPVSSDRST